MSTTSTPRVTAGITDVSGQQLSRDEYDDHLWQRLNAAQGAERPVQLSEAEAQVMAELLDELSALYPGEKLGRTAREMAVRLYDRLGI
jgi:hypothetical protein